MNLIGRRLDIERDMAHEWSVLIMDGYVPRIDIADIS